MCIRDSPDAGLSILDTAYANEDYAIAINKQNTDPVSYTHLRPVASTTASLQPLR